jgi:hypothetical protein
MRNETLNNPQNYERVILSEVAGPRSEAATQSKDP